MKISAKELRDSPARIIKQAAKGTEVVITLRGKEMAKIIPYSTDAGQDIDQDKIFGLWENHPEISDVDEHVRSLRKGRKL